MHIRTMMMVAGTVGFFGTASMAWADPEVSITAVETEMESLMVPPSPTEAGPSSPIAPANTVPPADDSVKSGSRFHGTVGLDITTTYMSRGLLSKDKGFIAQPYAILGMDIWSGEKCSWSADVGMWNSMHGDTTGASASAEGFQKNWFETDWTIGLNYKYDIVGFRVAYNVMTSPSDSFKTIEEVQFAMTLDDSGWMGAWAMNPSVLFVHELGRNGSDGAGLGEGSYLELGLTPGFDWTNDSFKARVNFPMLVGLSLDDFYENAANKEQTFGFAEVGCRCLVPLNMPKDMGNWTLTGGVRCVFLGEAAKQFNTNRDSFEVIGTLGLSVSF